MKKGKDLFHPPGLSVEVAKQCSRIRSSIDLVITSIIAGQLFLRIGWKKLNCPRLQGEAVFAILYGSHGVVVMGLALDTRQVRKGHSAGIIR